MYISLPHIYSQHFVRESVCVYYIRRLMAVCSFIVAHNVSTLRKRERECVCVYVSTEPHRRVQ